MKTCIIKKCPYADGSDPDMNIEYIISVPRLNKEWSAWRSCENGSFFCDDLDIEHTDTYQELVKQIHSKINQLLSLSHDERLQSHYLREYDLGKNPF